MQVFEAHEQRLDAAARRQWREMGWVEKSPQTYTCPADRQLQVAYHMTPAVRGKAAWEQLTRPVRNARDQGFQLPHARCIRQICALMPPHLCACTTPCSMSTPKCPPLPSLIWQEISLRMVWEYAPAVAFYAFGISFLGVALAIGIFAPRRQMPTDIFAVRNEVERRGLLHAGQAQNRCSSRVVGLRAHCVCLRRGICKLRSAE